jgi:predicted O-methyltransferase YrrM
MAPRGLRNIANGVSAARAGLYVPPGHFYSPISSPSDRERALLFTDDAVPGVDLRAERQLEYAREVAPMWADLPQRRWRPQQSGMYGVADAAVWHALLRHERPGRIVEVGSGYSTAVALDTAETHGTTRDVTCIEPYAERLRSLLQPSDSVRLFEQPVQDVPLDVLTSLDAGDVLFIDSTHVVKAGSDVLWLMLQVLPRLSRGVLVHIHDIHWPFAYPPHWVRQGRDWTETYLVHAFLAHNDTWEIKLWNSWLWKCHPEIVEANLPAAVGKNPGSLWLRRVA